MTFAELVAACFWPFVVLSASLLATIKDAAVLRFVAAWVGWISVLYLGLWIYDPQSSIMAIVDTYLAMIVFGSVSVGFGYNKCKLAKPGALRPDLKQRAAGIGLVLFGALMVVISASVLFEDFCRPRLVIEGRVDHLRSDTGRRPDHLADIGGRTVKATTPVFERLQFKPYVRAEVGQGSNYIFRIEYL